MAARVDRPGQQRQPLWHDYLRGDNTLGTVFEVSGATSVNYGIFTTDSDIGSPSFAGSANDVSGTYTVSGSGTGIAGTSDQFNYLFLAATGTQEAITASIPGISAASGQAG